VLLRQRDVQDLRRVDRVVEEHLIKIADPEKKDAILILTLDFQILLQHRRHLAHGRPLYFHYFTII